MGPDPDGGERERGTGPSWLERHLGLVVALAFGLCLLALLGRALTG